MKKGALVLFSFALVLSMVFPAHAQAPKFPDVPKNYWAYEQIRYVSKFRLDERKAGRKILSKRAGYERTIRFAHVHLCTKII